MNYEDLMKTFKATEWLIEDFCPEGSLTVMGGDPGSGKSWLLLAMAVSICFGEEYLGHFTANRSGPVIYVGQDGPLQGTLERAAALSGGRPVPNLYIFGGHEIELDTAAGILPLKDAVTKHRPALVIIDTLTSCVSTRFNEDRVSDISMVVKNVRSITEINGAAVVVAHHFRKDRTLASLISGFRGSSSIGGHADVAFGVHRLNPNAQTSDLLVVPFPKRYRVADSFRVSAVLSTSSASVKWAGPLQTSITFEDLDDAQRVFDFVRQQSDMGASVRQVYDQFQAALSMAKVRELLRSLHRDNWLDLSVGPKGQYRYVAVERADDPGPDSEVNDDPIPDDWITGDE